MIIMMLIIVLGVIGIFTYRLDRKGPEQNADRQTAAALAEAKEVLIGWAALDGGGTNPGRLPCPDQDWDDKSEGAACGNPFLGWIPALTLNMEAKQDRSQEHLWYIVDKAFRTGGAEINSSIVPTLTFNGRPIIAAIIAPGSILSALGQARPSLTGLKVKDIYPNYLESVLETPTRLITAPTSNTFNDQVLTISPEELFSGVTFRMARELAASWKEAKTFPMAVTTPIETTPPIWTDNKWDDAIAMYDVTAKAVTIQFVHCNAIYTIDTAYTVTRTGLC